MDNLSSIRIHKDTQVRLAKLAKELGMPVTKLASIMLDKHISEIRESGNLNLTVKRSENNTATVKLN